MALAETAELAVRLSLDDRMSPAIRKTQSSLRTLGSTAKTVGKGIAVGIGVGAAAGIVALTGALKSGVEALKRDQVVAAQTAAVIKSTGGAAGVTADAVAKLADKLSVLDGVSDDVVQSAENMLLTFTHIGADIFPDVTAAALDMAAALGTDSKNAAVQLGKALNDPITGLSRLTRLGITFTADQQAQIKALARTNHLHEAQALILGEVQRKFQGVAQAQADADPSRRLAVGVEKFQKALASGLLPVIEKVQVRLTEWLTKPETLATIQKVGDSLAALFTDANLDAAASAIQTAAGAVKVALDAFNSLPPEVKALAIGAFAINKVTGGAVGGLAEGFGKVLGAGLQKIFAANVTVIGTNVTGGGGVGGAAGGASNVGKVLSIAAIVGEVAAVVATQQEISGANSQRAGNLQSTLNRDITLKTPAELTKALAGVEQGIRDLESNPLSVLVRGDALTKLQQMRETLITQTQHADTAAAIGFRQSEHESELTTAALDRNSQREAAHLARSSSIISSHITRMRERLASLQSRLASAKEHHDSARAHQLQAKVTEVRARIAQSNARLATANQKLQAIVNKPWHLTIPINNQISIADYQNASGYHRTVAHQSSLTTKVIR